MVYEVKCMECGYVHRWLSIKSADYDARMHSKNNGCVRVHLEGVGGGN